MVKDPVLVQKAVKVVSRKRVIGQAVCVACAVRSDMAQTWLRRCSIWSLVWMALELSS